jgi:SAM-dependent methyltransferase
MHATETKTLPGLTEEVQQILRCPSCGSGVVGKADGVACRSCGRTFPRIGGVLRFVEDQAYTGSFGFEWNKHDRTQLDSENDIRSEQHFLAKTGLRPEDLAGKLVLDVGCGMGRFADVVTRWGARLVGIDLSQAVEAAQRNLTGRNAVIIQADIFSLPFAPESFDCIYSLGVLHHTPNCEEALKKLPSLLKPGGVMAVWLYSAYNRWYRCGDIYRKVTRRMPPKLLHTLCYSAIPLYELYAALRKIPLVGRPMSGVLNYLIPISLNEDPQYRVLDTFDWYSPWYQSKHTYEEVFRWFESCGMEDLHVGEVPVSVRGRKPASHDRVRVSERESGVSLCAE